MSLKMKDISFSIAKTIGWNVTYFFKNYIWEIPLFFNLSSSEQFVFLMKCSDAQIMAWFGKCINHSFTNRNILKHNARRRWGQWDVFLWLFRHWWQRLMTCGAVSEEGSAISWRSFVLECMCLLVCVPICWHACRALLLLKRLLIKIKCYVDCCSIIVNIAWFYSSKSFVFSVFLCLFEIFLYVRMSFYNAMFYMLVHVFYLYVCTSSAMTKIKMINQINHQIKEVCLSVEVCILIFTVIFHVIFYFTQILAASKIDGSHWVSRYW